MYIGISRRAVLTAPLLLAAARIGWAQGPVRRIRGTIKSLDGSVLNVETKDGSTVAIALLPDYQVGAIAPITLDQIKPGSMVGVVGFGPPKQQRAGVVTLFPPGLPVPESQFPWDSQPDSVMTNAPVTAEVTSGDGRVLTVTIKGEPIQVTVPANAVIQAIEPGSPALLTPGAKVLIITQQGPHGALSTARILAGKNGFAPAN